MSTGLHTGQIVYYHILYSVFPTVPPLSLDCVLVLLKIPSLLWAGTEWPFFQTMMLFGPNILFLCSSLPFFPIHNKSGWTGCCDCPLPDVCLHFKRNMEKDYLVGVGTYPAKPRIPVCARSVGQFINSARWLYFSSPHWLQAVSLAFTTEHSRAIL